MRILSRWQNIRADWSYDMELQTKSRTDGEILVISGCGKHKSNKVQGPLEGKCWLSTRRIVPGSLKMQHF